MTRGTSSSPPETTCLVVGKFLQNTRCPPPPAWALHREAPIGVIVNLVRLIYGGGGGSWRVGSLALHCLGGLEGHCYVKCPRGLGKFEAGYLFYNDGVFGFRTSGGGLADEIHCRCFSRCHPQ